MSNDNTSGLNGANGDGDLRDPALRRALDHAPDHDAAPDPRTRDAILKMAHNLAPAVMPSAAANNASAAPWWRRLFGGGDTRSRMPWNAAFATVLVATFVAVLWHREPIPDAQLDGEARVGGATAQAPAAAPTPPSAGPVQQAPSPVIVAPQAPALPAAEPPAAIARDSAREAPAERSTADAVRRSTPPPPVAKQAAPATAPAPAPKIDAKRANSPTEPVVPAPVPPAPVTAAPDAAEQSARARKSSENESAAREKRSTYAAGTPAPSAAAPSIAELDRSPPALAAAPAPAPAATAPMRRELADSPSAFPGQGQANAEASGGLRQAPAPRAAAAAKAARPQGGTSSFAALDRWTAFDFARAGPGVRHARGDIEGLAALVNTVARSATEADVPLAAPVEARLSFYEGGTLIAVLEIAGDQVRWTPQSGGTASVGTPPAQTLGAMRALLTR